MDITLQVGVKVLLRNSEGRFLLLHRSSKKYPEVHNPWDIAGGRINPGSTLVDNLKREVKEETGLELLEEPTLIAAQDILKNPERHIVRLTYLADITGEPKLNYEEHDEYRWFSLEEVQNLQGLDTYVENILPELIYFLTL